MFLTWGALGMFMKSELVKKEIRRLASRFAGTSWAASLIVRSRWKRLICKERQESIQSYNGACSALAFNHFSLRGK
jgi:hypothetical protein